MRAALVRLLVCVVLLLRASSVWAVTVTPDVVWKGDDAFQSTSVNVPIPSGITTGMLMLIASTWQAGTESATLAGGTSGVSWTSFGTIGANGTKFAFYKIADASDASDSLAGGHNWVFTCRDGFIEQWAGAAWSGVNTTTPFATGPDINSASSTNWSFTSETSPGTGSIWVGLAMIENNSVSMTQPGPPPTNQQQSTSGYYFGPGVVYSAQVDSGSFAPAATINSGFNWGTVAFFLNPSGGGGCTTKPSLALIGVGGCGS